MPEKIRTFIAIDTPPEFKIRAEEIQHELDTPGVPVRWEKSYKMHLTLKFLGDTGTETLKKIEPALENLSARAKPFWLRYAGLGCFPNAKNPRIVWVGCNPLSADLDHMQQNIENEMADLGFEKESRPFHPHITIGRIKTRSGKEKRSLPDLIKKMENVTFDALENEVHSILLMKSELRQEGSVYTILKQFSLTS